MDGSNCLQCGHPPLRHYKIPYVDEVQKPHYGRGRCYVVGWLGCPCNHYVGREKTNAATVLAAHGIGTWSGL